MARKLRSLRPHNGVYHGPPAPPVVARPIEPVYVWLKPLFDGELARAASQFPDDWYFLYWKNHPMKFRRRMFGNTEEGINIATAMQAIVTAHNGWTWPDTDGVVQELPETTTEAFWDALPMDLLLAMLAAITNDVAGPLPNSVPTTSASSGSTSSSSALAAAPRGIRSPGPTSEPG